MTACRLAAASTTRSSHLLIVSLVLSKDLFSHFLLSLVDVGVKLVSVLANTELLVVIDGNKDLFSADWFLIRVVELGDVWVLEGLFGCETLTWVELEQVFEEVNGVI